MPRTLLFSSYHNYIDLVSGAAVSAREFLLVAQRNGWRVKTLCGNYFDDGRPSLYRYLETSKRRNLSARVERHEVEVSGVPFKYDVVQFEDQGVISKTVFVPSDAGESRVNIAKYDNIAYLLELHRECSASRPDIYMSYGGYTASIQAAQYTQKLGARNVFFLCNHSYTDAFVFNSFDSIIVPSEYTRSYYSRHLNIDSTVIPPLLNERQIVAQDRQPKYLTIINPSPEKGLRLFSAIQKALARLRPDIPILIVLGRACLSTVCNELETFPDQEIQILKESKLPKSYFSQTRLLLFPSLVSETFGRVAVEAGFNRIPTLCTNRGALPETLGRGGVLFDVPEKYDWHNHEAWSETDVMPWVETIVKLWDSPDTLDKLGDLAYNNALQYSYARTSQRVVAYLSGLTETDVAGR